MILFLIGYRATGKTTVGRLLSRRFDCRWLDTDAEIEKFSQRSIADIFAADGEAGFRQIEQKVIKTLASNIRRVEMTVMSLGGGAVTSESVRELIGKRGKAVWLTAATGCLVERIVDGQIRTPRPALTNESLTEEVRKLLNLRQPIYSECADYTVDTTKFSPEQTVDQIAQWWSEVDKKS